MNAIAVLVISLLVLMLIDTYTYQSVKRAFTQRWMRRGFWSISIAGYLYILYTFSNFDAVNEPRKVINGFMILIMLWYVPKFLVMGFLLIEDIARFSIGLYRRFLHPDRSELGEQFVPGRRVFVQQLALGLAAIPFLGVIHGIWKGRYNFRVVKQTLFFDDLPDAFDGFLIAQLSDIHSGSFDLREKVQYGVDLLKAQNPDLYLFTGDMVNNLSDEMLPWVDTFKTIRAPHGQFGVLGNHDYGDYVSWDSEEDKAANLNELLRIQNEELQLTNLRNTHTKIEKDGQSITILGVENWGKGFHQYGDLDKALDGVDPKSFKILMSHDPTHFDEKVVPHDNKVHLTLSGHTHGMQFGIEIPGVLKWSPASFRYPKWAGLYEEKGKYLYVNRGFGYLAFPGRVGIWPEITLLELRVKRSS